VDAFEIPPERIPLSLDAQAPLYRSLLADRRVLVVLDNTRDTDQVRPLLPGSFTCQGRDHQPQPAGQLGHTGRPPPGHPWTS
jgi:hypothetical protein